MNKHQKEYRTLNKEVLDLISQILDRHTKAIVEESIRLIKIRHTSEVADLHGRIAVAMKHRNWDEVREVLDGVD